jgi:DNA-directed RNA polymerase specialized sigma24 family protein
MTDVTRILSQIDAGDPHAAELLLPLVYDELRKLAAARLAHEKPGQTLQATALVHEAYLRLVGGQGDREQETGDKRANPTPVSCPLSSVAWHSRGHFFAAAAEAMRRILINRARDQNRQKRGGGMRRVELDAIEVALDTPAEDLLALDEALGQLAEDDKLGADLVQLRFFAGLSLGEAAEALGMPRRTADRHWAYARAWLFDRLGGEK